MKKKIYCVIPARSGSKRIPKKNIKEFCGLPIIAWSIKSALNSNLFDEVIVSTDEDEIANISLKYGAKVPFKRPKKYSEDYSTTSDVINHFLTTIPESINTNPIVFCLYATAPFITEKEINLGFSKFIEIGQKNILFLAKEYIHPIERSFSINESGLSVSTFIDSGNYRTQDLIPKFHDAGQFYIGSAQTWQFLKSVIDNNFPLVIPELISHDIDNLRDWNYAEKLFKILHKLE